MAYRVGIVGASGIVINTPKGEPSPPLDKEISTSHVSGLSYMPDVELSAICDINPGGAGTVQEGVVGALAEDAAVRRLPGDAG